VQHRNGEAWHTVVQVSGSIDEQPARQRPANESALLARLRDGDEAAFVDLVERYQPPLQRFLRNYLPSQELAEDVAQETWLAVLNGLDRFEERSSLKTWIFRIGANRAQSRMRRERRLVSFSALRVPGFGNRDETPGDDLLPSGFSSDSGMWTSVPRRWDDDPEDRLLANETVAIARETIGQLPPMQAAVITLRDIDNWTSAEVCEALNISEANQRVLLHRARVRVRKALEKHLEGGQP
jgi:RNA polymerase sigma-70 factor, ECF subfamily